MASRLKSERSPVKEIDAPTLAARYLRRKAAGKKGYKDSDSTMDALESALKPGEIVTLKTGKKFKFVDTWEGKSRVNAGMNVRRFDLELVVDP